MKKYTLIIVLILVVGGAAWWRTVHRLTPPKATTGYVIRDGKVYYDTVMQVQWADNKIHQQIHEFEVSGADAKTFMAVSVERGVNILADTDPQTFAGLSWIWGKDKEHIFFEGNKVLRAGTTTPEVDTRTFKPVSELFVRDAQRVYLVDFMSEGMRGYREIPGLDPDTFVLLNRQYAKDARAVYFIPFDGSEYGFAKIPDLDPSTFRIVGFCGGAEVYQEYYIADAYRVLVKDAQVVGADPATFRMVGLVDKNPDGISITGSYAVDKDHVYKDCGEVVPGASPTQCTADNLKGCEGE